MEAKLDRIIYLLELMIRNRVMQRKLESTWGDMPVGAVATPEEEGILKEADTLFSEMAAIQSSQPVSQGAK